MTASCHPNPRRRRLRQGAVLGALLSAAVAAGLGWWCWPAAPAIGSAPRPTAAPAATAGAAPAGDRRPAGSGHSPTDANPDRAGPAATAPPAAPAAAGRRVAHVSDEPAAIERRLLDAVRYLASDELEGRGVGTAGIELAAQFIATEFQAAGLRTDLAGGSPFQRFARSVKYGLTGRNALALLGSGDRRQTLELGRTFLPLSLSGSGTFDLPLVFVGYGITAPEQGYDDYQGLDVAGKAVLVLRHEPQPADPGSVFHGRENSPYAHLSSKIANAVRHGAAAVVFCSDRRALLQRAGARGRDRPVETYPPPEPGEFDALMGFQISGAPAKREIPVLHVLRPVLEEPIREATGYELAAWEQTIDDQLQPCSQELTGWRVAGEVNVGRRERDLKNVLAALDGQGQLAAETIVVGGHYDHLGYGGSGSLAGTRAIHNGADDNASGTAAVVELARLLAAEPVPLPRRVLFIAFTAEESGLVGSEYYVGHPVVPLQETVAMLNLDMIGYLRKDRLEVSGSGTAAEFPALLSRFASDHGLRLELEPSGDGPSDHASFYEHGVPVLHLFTGLHPHYHRPSDDYDRLNYEGLRRITEFARDLVRAWANAEQRPQFRGDLDEDLLAEFFPTRRRSQPAGTLRPPPTLGIVSRPDRAGQGCVVSQVVRQSLAARSGLRAGDQIEQIGPQPIASPEELQAAVRALPGGAKVPVRVRRGTVELELDLTLPQ